MASWMIHLRIADKLLDRLPGLSPVEFIVGNIAPDSGVPNADWSAFTPSTTVSHFKTGKEGKKPEVDISKYTEAYFTPVQQERYDLRQYSFFLGYLTHLLTDILWAENIYNPTKVRFHDDYVACRENFIWKVKEDWYDLDFLYLKKHPGFRAFRVYLGAVGFVNEFMEEFSADAFDNRREYITGFYLQEKDGLEREYTYLTEAEAESFVENTVEHILAALQEYCVKK